MRIARHQKSADQTARNRDALDHFMASVIRHGPVCTPTCDRAECQPCSRACPHIPQKLSSDPANHPIEPNIAPLAFEIKRLGVFTPCWSCEGHNDQLNNLVKTPAVWFYANSTVHLRVLGEAVSDIFYDRQISAPWRVRLGFTEADSPSTVFALEPDKERTDLTLSALHHDIGRIAEQLEPRMMRKAEHMKGVG